MTGYASSEFDGGPAPTITKAAGAGTTGTASIVGNEQAGQIRVDTSAGTVAGLIATIEHGVRDNPNFYPVVTPANDNAGAGPFFYAVRIDDFSWGLYAATGAPLIDGQVYLWNYFIP